MSDVLGGPLGEESAPRRTTTLYLRAVSLLLLTAGLARACEILGITPDGSDFSDLMPHWRAAAAGLLLIDLFAAVGLWVGAAWGPVMWAVALAVEVAMFTVFSDLFGAAPVRVVVHSAFYAGYLALAFLDWRRATAE